MTLFFLIALLVYSYYAVMQIVANKTFTLQEQGVNINKDFMYSVRDFFEAANFFKFIVYSEKDQQDCDLVKANIYFVD